jgi:hypothetical protein
MADPQTITQQEVIATLVSILFESLLIYLAARFVLDRSSFFAAIFTAILGSLAAGAVLVYVSGIWAIVLAVAVWSLVAALLFRAKWVQGAIIGLVAWVLWFLIVLAVRAMSKT